MTGTLRCYSFHSVKGGVGKSALSTMTALAEAQRGCPTLLIDMDLTGTSLSDVLPVLPPRWPEIGGALDLRASPQGWMSESEAATALTRRRDTEEGPLAVGVPFLNDYLLFQTPNWDERTDIEDPTALGWKLPQAPDGLRVLPSSALPRDLEHILPVVFDEERAAFLEARLEHFLDSLVPDDGERTLVIDTPPTIPGLSRAVLSLAIRLGRPGEKTPLAEDGRVPERLRAADIVWNAFIVSTMDWQDVRAAARWRALLLDEEREIVRWIINRAPSKDTNRQAKLAEILGPTLGRPPTADDDGSEAPPLVDPASSVEIGVLDGVHWVEESTLLHGLFREGSREPKAPADWLSALVPSAEEPA